MPDTFFAFSRLLPVYDAACIAGVHPGSVRRWIRQGKVRAFGRRGTYRVMMEDLLPPAAVSADGSLQCHFVARTRTSTREE